jgi:hypothetical protein
MAAAVLDQCDTILAALVKAADALACVAHDVAVFENITIGEVRQSQTLEIDLADSFLKSNPPPGIQVNENIQRRKGVSDVTAGIGRDRALRSRPVADGGQAGRDEQKKESGGCRGLPAL